MQLRSIEFLRVTEQMETQSTCLTGTRKGSQYKCKIRSHLDNWMQNTHQRVQIQSAAEAVETKQILFVSEQEVYIYSLKLEAQTLTAGGGHNSLIRHYGLEWEKAGRFPVS